MKKSGKVTRFVCVHVCHLKIPRVHTFTYSPIFFKPKICCVLSVLFPAQTVHRQLNSFRLHSEVLYQYSAVFKNGVNCRAAVHLKKLI